MRRRRARVFPGQIVVNVADTLSVALHEEHVFSTWIPVRLYPKRGRKFRPADVDPWCIGDLDVVIHTVKVQRLAEYTAGPGRIIGIGAGRAAQGCRTDTDGTFGDAVAAALIKAPVAEGAFDKGRRSVASAYGNVDNIHILQRTAAAAVALVVGRDRQGRAAGEAAVRRENEAVQRGIDIGDAYR